MLLTTSEAAELLRLSPATLERDRCIRPGSPRYPFIRLGRAIRYDRDVLLRLVEARSVGTAA